MGERGEGRTAMVVACHAGDVGLVSATLAAGYRDGRLAVLQLAGVGGSSDFVPLKRAESSSVG